ncbi:hypothetical protein ACIOD2_25800 [Amycolatopsis sp. NPDC088138]|uniref:hypothetical protein n=1 Tax=Amycolatopsis sp. NPDC088138 TaxID=3363938 RepID=UPI003804FF4A
MAEEDWRMVRTIRTRDTAGRTVEITVGLVLVDGQPEPAMRVNGGPTVLLPLHQVGGELLAAIRQMLMDWYTRSQS